MGKVVSMILKLTNGANKMYRKEKASNKKLLIPLNKPVENEKNVIIWFWIVTNIVLSQIQISYMEVNQCNSSVTLNVPPVPRLVCGWWLTELILQSVI